MFRRHRIYNNGPIAKYMNDDQRVTLLLISAALVPTKTRAPREINTKAKSHRPLRERNLARQSPRSAKRRTVMVKSKKKLRRRAANGGGFQDGDDEME